MADKERIDVLLVDKGFFPSREQARRAIMAGDVFVAGQRELKPGTQVPLDASLEVRSATLFVSRGGLKLAKALTQFTVNVAERVCLDVGASTGGFTDCMLKAGACHVYAVDVGYGQLDWGLRQDPRVTVLERTNIRHLTTEQVPPVDCITIDVSFISLAKVLPAVEPFLLPAGDIVALVKPQFEAGREHVGKKGVVRDPVTHERVINECVAAAAAVGLCTKGLTFSPIRGPEGNIEFLIHLRRAADDESSVNSCVVSAVVNRAHEELDSAAHGGE